MMDYIPIIDKPLSQDAALALSPLVLAFVGDGVHTLLVRTKVALSEVGNTNEMHRLTSDEVRAGAQAGMVKSVLPILSPVELNVAKRGRNTHGNAIAKNASVADYRYATGWETLIGFLYLTGQTERLKEIVEIALNGNML